MKKLCSLIFALTMSASAFSQLCDSLTSSCLGTFSRNGYFFDLEATAAGAVTIEGISTMSQNCGTRDISIYYRTSTYFGNESSAAGWTLVGNVANATPLCSVACPIPVWPVNIPMSVAIPAGMKYGFYITMTAGIGTLESHSLLPEGSIGAQDAQLILYTGKGQGSIGAFTGVLTAALTFQGTIQYSCATSIAEELNANSFSVFPNPTNGIFTIEAEGEVSIFNLLGEKIYGLTTASEKTTIDLSNHAKGIYFIRVQSGDEMFCQKLVKE